MKITAATIVALAVALSASLIAQQPRRDGRFEIQMEMDMPGMPMKIPPITTTQCITPEQANDPQKAMPPQGGRGNQSSCKVSDYKQDGPKVTWSMKCEGKEPMTGTGEFVYAADGYTGTMKMDRAGQPMTMKYTAKRLGDCTK
jgi:hypothetical protein